MKWSVGSKIGAGFGLAVVILGSLGAVTYHTTSQLRDTSELEVHSQEVLKSIEDLGGDMAMLEADLRGYIITGQESYLESYRSTFGECSLKTKALRHLLSDSPNQQRRLDVLEPLIAGKLAFERDAIEVRKTKGSEVATQFIKILSTLLMAEVNVHFSYPLLTRPNGRAALAMHVDDSECASSVLIGEGFRLLSQSDISR